jgi:hypothetical protein
MPPIIYTSKSYVYFTLTSTLDSDRVVRIEIPTIGKLLYRKTFTRLQVDFTFSR